MCDVEAYFYLPLLEELGYVPTQKYADAAEILAHSQVIGRHFDLYRDACFQTEVQQLQWDGAVARWIVSTNRGDRMRARFVVMASGPLHRPKLPGMRIRAAESPDLSSAPAASRARWSSPTSTR